MGYTKHDAVLVTVFTSLDALEKAVKEFRSELPPEWQDLVVGPVEAVVNMYQFYVFLPDGSKEGWDQSDEGDRYRQAFIDIFDAASYPDIVTVSYGGDYETEHGPTVESKRVEEDW